MLISKPMRSRLFAVITRKWSKGSSPPTLRVTTDRFTVSRFARHICFSHSMQHRLSATPCDGVRGCCRSETLARPCRRVDQTDGSWRANTQRRHRFSATPCDGVCGCCRLETLARPCRRVDQTDGSCRAKIQRRLFVNTRRPWFVLSLLAWYVSFSAVMAITPTDRQFWVAANIL